MAIAYTDNLFTQSAAGRLDPRVKLLLVACVLVLVFSWSDPRFLGALVVGIVLAAVLGGVPPAFISRIALTVLPFALVLVAMHGLFSPHGKTPLVGPAPDWVPLAGGKLAMRHEGLLFGLGMAARMYAVLLAVPLMACTTDISALVVALVRLRVPYKITFVISTALRFVPLLLGEIRTIIDAQRLRGLDCEKMGLARRMKVYSTIVVPLLLGAMHRSGLLEVALQARAFTGTGQRSYLRKLNMRGLDWLITGEALAGVAVAIWFRATHGYGRFIG